MKTDFDISRFCENTKYFETYVCSSQKPYGSGFYRDQVVQVQRPVHLEVGHGHDDGVDQVGAVREAAERLEQPTGQGGVDAAAVAGAARDHDPGERGSPGRVADGRVEGRAGHVQVHHVQAVHEIGQGEQRQEPTHDDGRLKIGEISIAFSSSARYFRILYLTF